MKHATSEKMALVQPQRLRDLRIADLRLRLRRIHRRQQFVAAALLLEEQQQAEAHRRRRTVWVKPWLQRRPLFGQYDTLFQELRMEEHGGCKQFLRVDEQTFLQLIGRLEPRIAKSSSGRKPLLPALKLAITLRYLATGNSYHSLAFSFRVAHNTISMLIPEVCDAIVQEYSEEQFNTPTSEEAWLEVANKFGTRWNFHNCCGAIDGKHIRIKKPKKSGSVYYNYKGFYSIVLLALVDADYKFLWINIGAPGSQSDCGIFNRSALEPALREGTLGLPTPRPLPHDDRPTPFFMVGDDAFPLRDYMVKPYPYAVLTHDQRVFNYRCSRARRVVENAFGICAARFRCFLGVMEVTPRNATRITKGAIVLHNVLRDLNPNLANRDLDVEAPNGEIVAGAWRDAGVMEEMTMEGRGPRRTAAGKQLRSYLKCYYNSPIGSVPWQEAAINA